MVRNKIHRALDGIEISTAIRAYDDLGRTSAGCLCGRLGAEGPGLLAVNASEARRLQNRSVHLDVIGLAVPQQAMVRLNDRCIAVDNNRVKVKAVGESPNDRQLKPGGRRLGAGGWRAWFRIGIRAPRRKLVIRIGRGNVRGCLRRAGRARRRPRRNAHIERVDHVPVGRIENADHSGTPNDRLAVERQPKLHVRIHGRRMIGREQWLRRQARNAENMGVDDKHAGLENVAHAPNIRHSNRFDGLGNKMRLDAFAGNTCELLLGDGVKHRLNNSAADHHRYNKREAPAHAIPLL